MAKKHHWSLKGDDGEICRFACVSCGGVLLTRNATPDDRHGPREWRLGAQVLPLSRKMGPPACEGRGKVKLTRVGRHVMKERAA